MLTPYLYQTIHEVPPPRRKLQGGRLSLAYVNQITERAYELQFIPAGTDEPVPNYAQARQEFGENHTLVNGVWVDPT